MGQDIADTKLVFEYEEFMKIVNSSAVSTLDSSTSEDLLSTSVSTLPKNGKKTPLEGNDNYVARFNPVNSFSTHKYPFFHKNITIKKKSFLKVLKKNLAQSVSSNDDSVDISKSINASLPAKFSKIFPIKIEHLEQKKLPFHRFDGKTNFPFIQWPYSVEEDSKEESQKRVLFNIILHKDLHVWKKDYQLIYLHKKQMEDFSVRISSSLNKIYKKTKLRSYPNLFCQKMNRGCKLFIYKRSKKDSGYLIEDVNKIIECNNSYSSNGHSKITYDQLDSLCSETIKKNCFIPLDISSDLIENHSDGRKPYLEDSKEINLSSILLKNDSCSFDQFSLNDESTPLNEDEALLHISRKKTSQKYMSSNFMSNSNAEANNCVPNQEVILQNDSDSNSIRISDYSLIKNKEDCFDSGEFLDSIRIEKPSNVEKDKIEVSLFDKDIKKCRKPCLKKNLEKIELTNNSVSQHFFYYYFFVQYFLQ